MWNTLKPREKRILKLLLATAAVIGGYLLIEPLLKDYQQVKAESLQLRQTLDEFLSIQDTESIRQKALAKRVPTFEIPVQAPQQSVLFRDKVTQQLQQCGLRAKSMELRQNKTKKSDGFNVWLVECQGPCQYDGIMRLIEELNKNPYYVGIEKLTLKVDSKDRNQMTFSLAVSTYAK
jgi:hypothetical protein